jgi:hypothetical protein
MSSVSLPVLRAELAKMTYFRSYKIIRRKQQQFGLRVIQLYSRRAAAIAANYVCSVGAMYSDLGRELHIPAIVG